jgi:hypothetical protein
VSSWVMDASGLLTGDAAARLPSCSDQFRAACRAVSLSEFMAPAFAEGRRDRSSSVVPGGGCSRKVRRVRSWLRGISFPVQLAGADTVRSFCRAAQVRGDAVYLVLLAGTVFLKEMPCGSSRLEGCLAAQVDVTAAQATAFQRTGRCIDRRLTSAHLTAADLLFPGRSFDPLPSGQGVESRFGERGARGRGPRPATPPRERAHQPHRR